jgi:hypothetical protein
LVELYNTKPFDPKINKYSTSGLKAAMDSGFALNPIAAGINTRMSY